MMIPKPPMLPVRNILKLCTLIDGSNHDAKSYEAVR